MPPSGAATNAEPSITRIPSRMPGIAALNPPSRRPLRSHRLAISDGSCHQSHEAPIEDGDLFAVAIPAFCRRPVRNTPARSVALCEHQGAQVREAAAAGQRLELLELELGAQRIAL